MNKVINGKVTPLTSAEVLALGDGSIDVEAELALAESRLRVERNRLLYETDFLALQDSPALSTEMTEYRQALRDLPSTADINNPVYPTRPVGG